jgi:hypothetical protein
MRKKPSLQRSLLSCAIALAATGMSQSVLAVDLCTGSATTSVNSGAAGNNCTLDVAGARVTVGDAGELTDGIYVSVNDGIVSNQGTVSQSRANHSGGASAYAINAAALGANAKITNSGVISANATVSGSGTNLDASAYGIHFDGNLTGSVITNSGRISTIATSDGWGGAYGVGTWDSVTLDGATIKNTSTGRIVSEASGNSASAYGIYGNGTVSNGTTISNAGLISLSAHGTSNGYASAWGIYQSSITTDSTISNSGTIEAMAETTGSDWAGAWGIYASSVQGASAVSNSGTIRATATASGSSSASAYGIDIDSLGGTSSVSNSGKIVSTATANSNYASAYGIYVSSAYDSAAILNSGSITATGTSLSNDAYAYGIYASNLYNDASITNRGSIVATANGNSWASAYGIYNGSLTGSAASITNSGTIKATATSLTSSASANGIRFNGSSTGGSITNSGTVTASVTADDWAGAYAVGAWNWGSTFDGTAFTNTGSGVIKAIAEGYSGSAYGMFLTSYLTNGASVTNNGTIHAETNATGDYASAYGIYQYYDKTDASVMNNGLITATASTIADDWAGAWGIAAFTDSHGDTVIGNTGTIRATATSLSSSASAYGIETGSLNDTSTVMNSGTIVARASSTGDGASAGTGVDLSAYAWGISAGDLNNSASITNSGTIVAEASANVSYASAYGIEVGNVNDTASISNSGTIVAKASSLQSSASANGIRFSGIAAGASVSNSGRIAVEATGAWTNLGWGGAYAFGNWNGGTLNGTFENSGVITAHAEGDRASAYGMFSNATLTGASVANTGTIVAVTRGNDASYASAYGMYLTGSKTDSSISNEGRIVVDVTAAGDEWAGAYGIYMSSSSMAGASTLDNSGSITATVVSAEASASAYGIRGGDLAGTSTLTNSGSLVARATANRNYASAYGIYTNSVGATSSITNTGTINLNAEMKGTTTNDDVYVYGIYAGSIASGATVTNNGTIVTASSGGNDQYVYGVGGYGSGAVVNSGLMIGGVELTGSVSVTNNGTIVSHSYSPSTVGGNYTQGADGVLGIGVQDATTFGSLTVGGTADFTASGKVVVSVDADNQLQDGDVLNDVISGGTLTLSGTGFDLSDTSLFWNFSEVVDGNTIDLDVSFGGAAAGLAASGQAFTATQLAFVDQLLQGGFGSDFSELAEALNGTSDAAAAADVLESVGPVLAGAATTAMRSAGQGASNAISARQGETRGAASGDAFTQNTLWIKPFLGKATQDSVSGVDGYDVDSTGFVIGLDGDVSDSWRVGVAVASSQSDVEGDKAELDVKSTQFTVYGSYALTDTAALDLNLDHVSTGVDGTRRVALVNSTARSSYDGSQFALGAALSTRVAMGDQHAFLPSLQARFQRVSLDGYSETGAGVYDLTVGSSNESSMLWAAEGAFEFGVGKGTLLANAGIGYDSLDAASVTATLNGGTGPTFVSNGIKPDSTVVTGGVGYRYVTAKALEINVAYDLESRGDFEAQTASVKFKLPF